MHVHLPKPLHGWRVFSGEVGIIVVGVLIALVAEQMVGWAHERGDIAQLRGALRSELADSRARWESIRSQDPCTEQRLDALDKWVASAPPNATLSNGYGPFLWNMHSSAWDLAKTSPVTERLPLKERLTYASLYAAIDNWRQFITEENQNSRKLTDFLATADQPENRRQIRLYLVEARFMLYRRRLNYDYFFKRFDELGIKPDTTQLTVRVDPHRLCNPLKT
jgi:hypothetical protein